MGDAGEGLIDAEDRFQQWVAEREQQKQRKGVASADPSASGKSTPEARQGGAGTAAAGDHERDPREQIRQALVEIERQLQTT